MVMGLSTRLFVLSLLYNGLSHLCVCFQYRVTANGMKAVTSNGYTAQNDWLGTSKLWLAKSESSSRSGKGDSKQHRAKDKDMIKAERFLQKQNQRKTAKTERKQRTREGGVQDPGKRLSYEPEPSIGGHNYAQKTVTGSECTHYLILLIRTKLLVLFRTPLNAFFIPNPNLGETIIECREFNIDGQKSFEFVGGEKHYVFCLVGDKTHLFPLPCTLSPLPSPLPPLSSRLPPLPSIPRVQALTASRHYLLLVYQK